MIECKDICFCANKYKFYNVQLSYIKSLLMLYKASKQLTYLKQARKLADELKTEQNEAGELTLFILSPKKE